MAQNNQLPKLPIPPLEDTCSRYLKVLQALQTPNEHQKTKSIVQKFLNEEGPLLHDRLKEYASTRPSYIEEFWYESYLQHSDSVVLNLNPFFILEDDPTPSRGNQLTRAASLILASVGFIHDLRNGELEPDNVKGIPLDMYQYSKLFSTARIPTREGCQMKTFNDSKHIVIMRRGQFYSFDVMDSSHRPVLSERELLNTIRTIIQDADRLPITKVAQSSIGLLTTERRPTWASLRQELLSDPNSPNNECLRVIDSALFIVCLDGSSPRTADKICGTMLCGTYELGPGGVQVGTCLNRWYDKLQIIVCADGQAGVNFEHSAVDGHTVLRFVGDVYTELILRFAKSINTNSRTLFKALPSPWSKGVGCNNPAKLNQSDLPNEKINTAPIKLEWNLSNTIKASIRFAETRLSDLICQNEVLALEFEGYGKNFITSQNLSPDAFVQMAFQVCYFSLYGRIESTYEPAMTKSFFHGRTEGIRSVSPYSVKFAKRFCSAVDDQEKVLALKEACQYHQKLTKECSQGLGQDRILYAMYSLSKQQLTTENHEINRSSSEDNDLEDNPAIKESNRKKIPKIFRDGGYGLLNHSTLSTSNCGNPALRLFGFGPVVSDGYGIGYIIKEDGLSFVISSKHLQTKRFLDRLKSYFIEIRKILISTTARTTDSSYTDLTENPNLLNPHQPSADPSNLVNNNGNQKDRRGLEDLMDNNSPERWNPPQIGDSSNRGDRKMRHQNSYKSNWMMINANNNQQSDWQGIWNDRLQLIDTPNSNSSNLNSPFFKKLPLLPLPPQQQQQQSDLPIQNSSSIDQIAQEDSLTSGYGFFDSGEIDKIFDSNTQMVRNQQSKKFNLPVGTKLEVIND